MGLSDTLTKYKDALIAAQERQQKIYNSRSENVGVFYNSFLNQLIRKYDNKIGQKEWEKNISDKFIDFFGTNKPMFFAIDGTSNKIQLEEYAVFFAASCGVKGTISLDEKNSIKYEKRPISDELSMVTYVPIPFAELDDVDTSQFDDDKRFAMTNIHNKLMILSEIYLLYREIKSENHPNIILWDQTFSGMFHWAPSIKKIPMIINSYEYYEREITIGDALIARSHPYNSELGVPTASKGLYNIPNRIFYELFASPDKRIKISEIAKLFGESWEDVKRVIDHFILNIDGGASQKSDCLIRDKDIITLNPQYEYSWDFVIDLVESLCSKIFIEKDHEALIYNDNWITVIDIDFMMFVLLRRIIEISWEKNILLIGIVKDSASKHFTRNYLGVMRKKNNYSGYNISDTFNLLWSDRLTMEHLPSKDENLNAPWTTIEYDSVFQIAYLTTKTPTQEIYIRNVPSPEKIFAKHLSLLSSIRQKGEVIFNHMLFVDRVLIPKFDKEKINSHTISAESKGIEVNVNPFVDLNNSQPNIVQDFVTMFLHKVSSNKFSDVIGYPQPLHIADLEAKTFNRMISPMISSSIMTYDRSYKPWSKSVRANRRFR